MARPKTKPSSKRSKKKKEGVSSSQFSWLCCILALVAFSVSVLFFLVLSTSEPASEVANRAQQTQTSTVVEISIPVAVNPVKVNYFRPSAAPVKKPPGALDFHFIHIPKCGGTSMTAILRDMACHIDPERNVDCCTNPGFCDWHAFRRCTAIKGCTDHFPNRKHIFKPMPSITLMRDPVSRLISAWFYRGHTPNNDFFQVRPYFKDIFQGKLPKVKYEEYIEMPEYQNIQTRMLGADSFPYRNITITDEVYRLAVEALNKIAFVGLQEAYDISVRLLLREMNMDYLNVTVFKERDQSDRRTTEQKNKLRKNKKLMERTKDVNLFDIKLYKLGTAKFCAALSKYPDLVEELKTTKVVCNAWVDIT